MKINQNCLSIFRKKQFCFDNFFSYSYYKIDIHRTLFPDDNERDKRQERDKIRIYLLIVSDNKSVEKAISQNYHRTSSYC